MRNKALKLIDQYITNINLKRHLLAVEAVMKELAKRFNENQERWALAGLLHDLDWELTKENPHQHSLISAQILTKEGFDDDIIQAIKIHNHLHELEPKTLLDKALYCAEELTGLITACALVNPKRLEGVTLKSVLKKFKEKSFAKGVNREIILKSEKLLNIKLDELINLELKAMKTIKNELGL